MNYLSNYNQNDYNSSKLLIVADCRVEQSLVNVLCDKLNTNADLLYIDSSRETRKKALERHFSYLILAIQAMLIGHKYENIIFWQQFIGLYWSFYPFKSRVKFNALLTPLIYKSRKGILGQLYRLFFGFCLSNSVLKGAICHSSDELKYYQTVFPDCKNKIFFIPYGITSEVRVRQNLISEENSYFFAGGTSNRDYSTLMYAAAKLKQFNFVVACTKRDIKGIEVPDNVKVLHDAYGEKFDLLIKSSLAVVLTLENPNISSGQIVLLKAMEMEKPIIVTKCAGITDYIDEDCAFLVNTNDPEDLRKVLELIISNPEEANVRAKRAQERYRERFTVQKFASLLAELINYQGGIGC